MKKDTEIVIVVLLVILFLGLIISRYLFPIERIVTENDASLKCKEAGGTFNISYDYVTYWQRKINGEFDVQPKLLFECYKEKEIIFKM